MLFMAFDGVLSEQDYDRISRWREYNDKRQALLEDCRARGLSHYEIVAEVHRNFNGKQVIKSVMSGDDK